mgnify:CR=1 FL=1
MDAPQSNSPDLTPDFSTSLDLDLNARFGSFLDLSSDQFLGKKEAKTVCDVLSKLSYWIPSDESLIRVRGQLLSDIMSICKRLNSTRDGDLSKDSDLSKREKTRRKKALFNKKLKLKEPLNRIQEEANMFQMLGELKSVDEQESYTGLRNEFLRLHQEGAKLAEGNSDPSAKNTHKQHQKKLSKTLTRQQQALIPGQNDTFSGHSNSGIIGGRHGGSLRQLQHAQGLRQDSEEYNGSTELNDGSELGSRQAAREGELPRGSGHELEHESSESNGASHHASSVGGLSQEERKESSRDIGSRSLMRHFWGSPKLPMLGGALTLCSIGGGIQSFFYSDAMISRFFPALSYDIPCISLWIMVVALLLFASISYIQIQDSLDHGVFLECLLVLCLGCVLELPVAFMPIVFMATGITGGVLVLGGLISYMFSAPEMTQDKLSPKVSARLHEEKPLHKKPPSNASYGDTLKFDSNQKLPSPSKR